MVLIGNGVNVVACTWVNCLGNEREEMVGVELAVGAEGKLSSHAVDGTGF